MNKVNSSPSSAASLPVADWKASSSEVSSAIAQKPMRKASPASPPAEGAAASLRAAAQPASASAASPTREAGETTMPSQARQKRK